MFRGGAAVDDVRMGCGARGSGRGAVATGENG